MAKTYILTRPQRVPCCRINSAYAGAFLMHTPALPTPARPKLTAYLGLLNFVTGVMGAVQTDLTVSNPALIELNQSLAEEKWLNESRIKTLNQLIKDNFSISSAIARYFEIQPDASEDPFGLLSSYLAIAEDENQQPELNEIEKIIYFSEKYLVEKHPGVKGLEQREAMGGIQHSQLVDSIGDKKNPIKLMEAKTVFKDEAAKYIDTVFNDNQDQELIQLTTGGHSTVFGKKNGQYWQFDSLGHVTVGDGECVCTTLTVYDNKEEAKKAMLDRASKAASEFSKITVTATPAVVISDSARNALTRQIADLMESLQKNQENVGLIGTRPLASRYDLYQAEYRKLQEIESTLRSIEIPSTLPALISSKDIMLETIISEMAKQSKFIDDAKNASIIAEHINLVHVITPQTPADFVNVIEGLEDNIIVHQSLMSHHEISNPMLKEEVRKHARDTLLTNAFLPLADAAVQQAQALLKKVYHDDALPDYYGQIENLDRVIGFLEKNKNDSSIFIQEALITNMQGLRESLVEKLPRVNRAFFSK